MPSSVVTILAAILVPVVTAILGVLAVMFQDWRVHKTQAGRRTMALEDARRQVSFAAEWWNAKKLLTESPEAEKEATVRALRWLEEASELVAVSDLPATSKKPRITFRRLLLFYRLQGRAAKVIRIFFYISLSLLIVLVLSTIIDAAAGVGAVVIVDLLVFSSVTALVTLGFRFWAVSAQNPKPESWNV